MSCANSITNVWRFQQMWPTKDSVIRLVQQSLSHFKRIDILVNGASLWCPAPVEGVTEEIWDEVYQDQSRQHFSLLQSCGSDDVDAKTW